VYAPEIVAEAIVFAAENPRREIAVGDAAVGFVTGQRLSPALTDALLSIPRLGVGEAKSDRPDNGQDNVDTPSGGPGQVHGGYPGTVLRHSALTSALARVPRPGDVLTGALSTLRRLRSGGETNPVRTEPGHGSGSGVRP
jgi:hypothetical protein